MVTTTSRDTRSRAAAALTMLALAVGSGCASQAEPGAPCDEDLSCGPGLKCQSGLCTWQALPCATSEDCPRLQVCDAARSVCVEPVTPRCLGDEDCADFAPLLQCDPATNRCVAPEATSDAQGQAVPGADATPATAPDAGAATSTTGTGAAGTDAGRSAQDDGASSATTPEACLPEDTDCELSDDQCCDGFHCCPVFRICVVDWWD